MLIFLDVSFKRRKRKEKEEEEGGGRGGTEMSKKSTVRPEEPV